MKVVLFCGGAGTRLRDYSEAIPKPMVTIGYRPILWHVMKYYARFGHNDFILCLGYKADVIKDYFLNYDEALSNDFVLQGGAGNVQLLQSDIDDWRITFVDTGMKTNIGGRLRAVREHLAGEEMFLANYADTLTDAPISDVVAQVKNSNAVASFLAVRPSQSFHVIDMDDTGQVESIRDVQTTNTRINGGYFVLRQEIFNYMNEGDELVIEPFAKLIEEGKLLAYRHDGFWACMDTFKEKTQLEDLYTQETAPWEVVSPTS
jgi:glucose-1-phosphate cytidylyltransferase